MWKDQMIVDLQDKLVELENKLTNGNTVAERYEAFVERKKVTRALELVRGFEE